MKRLILIAAFILTAGTLAAQNYIIVNSEKVFKSIDAYNTAISDLDKLARHADEETHRDDLSDPETGLRRHRDLRQAGRRRPGARLGEQPHAALHQPFGRADAAGDRRTQKITDIKTLTDKTV